MRKVFIIDCLQSRSRWSNISYKEFRTALKFKPNDATNYFNLGIALKRQGKNEKAIEHFEKAGNQTRLFWGLPQHGCCLQEQDRRKSHRSFQ